jgi:hypothetical protein
MKRVEKLEMDHFATIENLLNSKDVNILELQNVLLESPDEVQNNKEIAFKLLKVRGWLLSYLSSNLKKDKQIVTQAILNDNFSFFYADPKLKDDKEFVLSIMSEVNCSILEFVSQRLKNDKEVVLFAVREDSLLLHFASKNLRNDREIVFEAVKQNGACLQFASESLVNDKDFIMSAIEVCEHWTFKFVGSVLKNDKEVLLKSVRKEGGNWSLYGPTIQFASKELVSDKEFILEVFKLNGNSLGFIYELDKDMEVIWMSIYHFKLIKSVKCFNLNFHWK